MNNHSIYKKLKRRILEEISWRLKKTTEEIMIKIDNPRISIISFDIFDTLIMRPTILPEDIWKIVEKEVDLKDKFNFVNVRKDYSKRVGKYADINDIYDEIERCMGLKKNECIRIKETEILIETELAYKRKSIYLLYEYAIQKGKKVIAVSDMYLSSKVLHDILNKCGYTKIRNIYVSNELKARKDEGDLFKQVLKLENTSAKNVIHIGDNFRSDYIMARRIGIESYYYPSALEIADHAKIGNKKLFDERIVTDWAARVMFGAAINCCFDDFCVLNNKIFNESKIFSLMIIFPIVYSTVCKIMNDVSIQNEYKCIYFVSRDGYLPFKIYQKIGINRAVIDSKYIYASRRAYQYLMYSNAQNRIKNENFENQFTYQNFIESVVPHEKDVEIIKKYFTDKELLLVVKYSGEHCEKLLDKSKLIEDIFEKQREFAKQYYTNIITDIGKRKLVFDCGYSGSISEGLSNALGKTPVDKVYLWDTQTNKDRDKRCKTKTFLVLEGKHPTWAHVLYETCLSSFEGSCIGFYENRNVICPIIQRIESDTNSNRVLQEIQNNVEELSLELTNLLGNLYKHIIVKNAQSITNNTYRILGQCARRNMGILNNIQFKDSYQNVQNNSLAYIIAASNHSLEHAKIKMLRTLKSFKNCFIHAWNYTGLCLRS